MEHETDNMEQKNLGERRNNESEESSILDGRVEL